MLFYKEYIVYYNVYHDYSGAFIEIPVYTKFGLSVSELHAHPCPYRNVWPEAVYCCVTRTTLFTETYSMVVMDIYQCAKFRFSTPYGY